MHYVIPHLKTTKFNISVLWGTVHKSAMPPSSPTKNFWMKPWHVWFIGKVHVSVTMSNFIVIILMAWGNYVSIGFS